MEANSKHNPSIGEAHHTLQLTTTLLNGSNYTSWAISASLSLQSRGKLNHITGQITTKPAQLSSTIEPVPEGETPTTKTVVPVPNTSTDTSYQHWHQDDITVINWLLNSMEPQVSRLFMYYDIAKELWNEIKEMFGQYQNFAYIFHLKQEIIKIQQGSKTVTEYYGDL
jgi:gag-polypeptide of LTR copia-type